MDALLDNFFDNLNDINVGGEDVVPQFGLKYNVSNHNKNFN